jgi:hypothetical protein
VETHYPKASANAEAFFLPSRESEFLSLKGVGIVV